MASKPAGSSASLTVSDPIHPTFTPDAPGNYTVKLVVTDSLGRTSNPDEVIVSTANIAPVAYAGADQAIILMGSTVYLNGRGSQDDDGDPLTYSWTMTKPTGSNAILLNPTSQTPSFVVDLYGTYQVTLVVTDRWGAKSAPDTMLASFDNLPPLAQAVGNLAAVVGDMVLLDASASSDPNGDPLTYKWSLVSRPDGSLAGLSADTGLSTTFLVDVAGSYVVSLIANDGRVNSAPLNVTVAVITKQTETTQTLTEVVEAVNDPTTIPDSAFGNPNNRTPLTNKINAVIGMIDGGQYQQALDKLKTDILPKTDGCAVSGRPDNNDMIKTCPEQAVVYAWLTHAIAVLETMVPQP
jgi:PKD repeat protein